MLNDVEAEVWDLTKKARIIIKDYWDEYIDDRTPELTISDLETILNKIYKVLVDSDWRK